MVRIAVHHFGYTPQGRVVGSQLRRGVIYGGSLELLHFPAIAAILADSHSIVLELRRRSPFGLFPHKIGHAYRAYRSESSGRVVHVSANAIAFVLGLAGTLHKINTGVLAFTFGAVHAASSFKRGRLRSAMTEQRLSFFQVLGRAI